MTTNTYKCSKKIWKEFSEKAKMIFNSVMKRSLKNQKITSHPNMDTMTLKEWETVCYNFSCYAAWAYDKNIITKGTTVEDITPKGKVVKIRKVA